MSSPFPGMDPYLEGELWTSFHSLFVPEIVGLLNPQLRPRYVALAQKYHVVIPHLWIEILDLKRRRLVTAIEFLSPGNKLGVGRVKYLRNRKHFLESTAHLLEIDLLRHGQRLPMREPLPPVAYFVFLSRVAKRPLTGIWPVNLNEPLPAVPVPLLPEDGDITLNLQTAFTLAYDRGSFDAAVDYQQPPDMPLAAAEQLWAETRLREAGVRK